MTPYDSPASGNLGRAASTVIVRSDEDAAVRVYLRDRQLLGEYEATFAVDLHADGLDAHVQEVSVTPRDSGGLTSFMDGLAADFRGWTGSRSWTVNHLRITAVFHSGGYVELCWTIRPWLARAGWEASVTTLIEGGQQMTELAADIRGFMAQAQLRRSTGAPGRVGAVAA